MMESLTLDRALELYEILGVYVPEVDDKDTDALEFIGKIINNVNNSDDKGAYTVALELMSGNTLYELKEMSSEERINLFTGGLIQNKILDLKYFCEQVGF
ncbi:MAG: hypothetical protein ACXACY_27070 [Candidatus Hodarchaeales archaeon]